MRPTGQLDPLCQFFLPSGSKADNWNHKSRKHYHNCLCRRILLTKSASVSPLYCPVGTELNPLKVCNVHFHGQYSLSINHTHCQFHMAHNVKTISDIARGLYFKPQFLPCTRFGRDIRHFLSSRHFFRRKLLFRAWFFKRYDFKFFFGVATNKVNIEEEKGKAAWITVH